MKRAQQHLASAVAMVSIYLACLFDFVPLPSKVQDEIVPVLPFWALVSFGSYMLFQLGLGIYSFNDVPEAYEELKSEIEMAKSDLRARGVDVD